GGGDLRPPGIRVAKPDIVELSSSKGGSEGGGGLSAGNEDLPVRQQGRAVPLARGGERTGAGPGPRGWIVDLSTTQNRVVIASCDQHFAIGQQCGGMIDAACRQVASAAPRARGGIVQLRSGRVSGGIPATGH